jgi:hypothetical protein
VGCDDFVIDRRSFEKHQNALNGKRRLRRGVEEIFFEIG